MGVCHARIVAWFEFDQEVRVATFRVEVRATGGGAEHFQPPDMEAPAQFGQGSLLLLMVACMVGSGGVSGDPWPMVPCGIVRLRDVSIPAQ